jgi:flagellar basal-body rod modification protein FlgD
MNKLDATNFSLESLGSGAPKRQAVKELGQEQFLDLMVAQLRNQDPLKPMQNGKRPLPRWRRAFSRTRR